MLTGNNNPYFLRYQGLRLLAFYCLIMASSLGLLALVDWIDSGTPRLLWSALLAVLMACYGGYLLWRDRPLQSRWSEWLVVMVLVGWALMDAVSAPVTAHAAYWLPFFLVFAFVWRQAAVALMVFSLVFACVVLISDPGMRGQILTTYLLTMATALGLGWLNDREGHPRLQQLGSDPQTGAYNEQQLAADLINEVRRTDRQASRLLLAVVVTPSCWKGLRRPQQVSNQQRMANALRQFIRPFHTIYKLDSEDFVVLMPYGHRAEVEELESRVSRELGLTDELPVVALHYQSDDDPDTLRRRIEGAIHDFRH